MILSNIDIRQMIEEQKIEITPFEPKNLQAASLDITLSSSFSIIGYKNDTKTNKVTVLDLSEPITYKHVETDEFILYPRHFALASTVEYIKLPNDISVNVQGRSSIGRTGVFIQNAGWVDPGFAGQITLELFNAGTCAIKLHKGMRIGQLIFSKMSTPTDIPYNGKYQYQKGATDSFIFKDHEFIEGVNHE